MKVSISILNPSDNDIRVGHTSIRRNSESNIPQGLYMCLKGDGVIAILPEEYVLFVVQFNRVRIVLSDDDVIST